MRKRFDRVIDPSHSWLKVPVAELERLGIDTQISSYSYLKDGMAYLEEDQDMPFFLKARAERGEEVRIIEHIRNKQSRVRNYPSYQPDAVEVNVPASDEVDNAQTAATEATVADTQSETADA